MSFQTLSSVVNFGRFCQRVIKIIRFAGVNERGSERNATRRQQSNRVKKQDTTEGGDRRRPLGRTHSFSQYYARERVYFVVFISLTLFPNTIKKRRRENSVSGNRARARVVLPTITSRAAKNESKRFEDVLRKAHVQRSKKLRVVVVVVVVHSARILSSDVETTRNKMEWSRLEKNAFFQCFFVFYSTFLIVSQKQQ